MSKIRTLFIMNPCAGKSSKRPDVYDIVRLFPNNYEFTIEFTRCSGDATRIVKEKISDHDIVICAGGDGTLNECINGIMEMPRRIPIGYIPIGTTNDLATTLGISSKYQEAVATIVNGHLNWYDVGLFNNRYFTYTSAFGAFTKSSYNTSQKMKNTFGHTAYILNGLTEWKNVENFHAVVECDQGTFEGTYCFGTITDSTSVAGLFKLNKDEVRLDDGKFELLLVSEVKNLATAPSILRQMQKQNYDGKKIIMFHTGHVKITFDRPVAWTIDGEYGGEHKDIIAHNLSKAVRIFSPKGPLFDSVVPELDLDKERREAEEAQKSEKEAQKAEKEAVKANKSVAKAEKKEAKAKDEKVLAEKN